MRRSAASVEMRAREDAVAIWRAAVDAARPEDLVHEAFAHSPLLQAIRNAPRILVVGAGKAGAGMAAGVEAELSRPLGGVEGWINVPAGSLPSLQKIHLHVARPPGTNQPTPEALSGTEEILKLVGSAGPEDVCLCLISGGGSALLPAPVQGVTLADKQAVTRLLHACGASIDEMNAVRKHLSRVKGGRLAEAFTGKALCSLIISDVVGDPLDVIASGPTAPDPTTFRDALDVLERYGLTNQAPRSVRHHLEQGAAGRIPETPKQLPETVTNRVIGNNARALARAARCAAERGYAVVNLGSYIQGETSTVARLLAAVVRSIQADGQPVRPPACLLSGGETTVTLGADSGKGGRNQEFVLAALLALAPVHLADVVLLSGGTDGEDGPTDAAGAVADRATWTEAARQRLNPQVSLARHDAYPFFAATGSLIRTGLTHTNVMDVRVMLVGSPENGLRKNPPAGL